MQEAKHQRQLNKEYSSSMEKRSLRKTRIDTVVSNKMQKSIIVDRETGGSSYLQKIF